jgi:hypothetical protein
LGSVSLARERDVLYACVLRVRVRVGDLYRVTVLFGGVPGAVRTHTSAGCVCEEEALSCKQFFGIFLFFLGGAEKLGEDERLALRRDDF